MRFSTPPMEIGTREEYERWFPALFELLQSEARGWARRHLRGFEDHCDDAVQEAFIKIRRFEPPIRNFRGLLYVLVVNESHNHRPKRRDVHDEKAIGQKAAQDATPLEKLQWQEWRAFVEEAMSECLSDLQRKAMILRDFEDQPIEEVASQLETTPGGVKSALHVARRKVRTYVLQRWGHPLEENY